MGSMDPEQITKENSPLKQIRTFQGDVADALSKQKESLVSIQRSEHALKEAHKVFSPPKSPEEILESKSNKKLLLLLVGSFVLIGLGGLASWYAYVDYTEKTASPIIQRAPNKFLVSANIVNIDTQDISRESLILNIQKEQKKEIKEGTIVQIQLQKQLATTTTLISTRDFLNILESRAPGSLVRSFNPLFMLGFLGKNTRLAENIGTVHPFILIKLDSFENAFPGMLEWEKNMQSDLLPLFVSSTTPTNIASETTFEDVVIQNKDVRMLRNLTEQAVLLYTFFDNKMLIITDNENSLKIIVDKLNTEKLSR